MDPALLFEIASSKTGKLIEKGKGIIHSTVYDNVWLSLVQDRLELIEQGVFLENPDSGYKQGYCSYCRYKENCMRYSVDIKREANILYHDKR
jgi:hypothetical protein